MKVETRSWADLRPSSRAWSWSAQSCARRRAKIRSRSCRSPSKSGARSGRAARESAFRRRRPRLLEARPKTSPEPRSSMIWRRPSARSWTGSPRLRAPRRPRCPRPLRRDQDTLFCRGRGGRRRVQLRRAGPARRAGPTGDEYHVAGFRGSVRTSIVSSRRRQGRRSSYVRSIGNLRKPLGAMPDVRRPIRETA